MAKSHPIPTDLSFWVPSGVTRLGKIWSNRQNFKSLVIFLRVYLVFRKILKLLEPVSCVIWQFFIVVNGQIFDKINYHPSDQAGVIY